MVPELEIQVAGAEPLPHCVEPTLGFRLVVGGGEEPIQSVVLTAQIRIEAQRRRYGEAEKQRLFDLFGEPARWSQTLRSLLWTHATVTVPSFTGSCEVRLPVTCSHDFNFLVARYFHALDEEPVTLLLLFSGSVFSADAAGRLQVTPISWNTEASFQFPVSVWKSMMRLYYPNTAWLTLDQDLFDRLAAYKSRHGLPTWDRALERLLATQEEAVSR